MEDLVPWVRDVLTKALSNENQFLLEAPPEVVANDLKEYEPAFEFVPGSVLVPIVRAWQKEASRVEGSEV